MRIALWVVLISLAVAPVASAHDFFQPLWRGQEGTSTLIYDTSWTEYNYFNDYGGGLSPPQIHYEPGWNCWEDPMIVGSPPFGWYLPWQSHNSKLVFEMDNYDNNRLQKDIRIQVTFYAPNWGEYWDNWYMSAWAASNDAWEYPFTGWDSTWDLEYVDATVVPGYGENWVCAAFDLQLQPNPDSEIIALQFGSLWPWWYDGGGTLWYPGGGAGYVWIDQVVIDTRCTDMPEPGTTCLLLTLIGSAAMLRRRRRA